MWLAWQALAYCSTYGSDLPYYFALDRVVCGRTIDPKSTTNCGSRRRLTSQNSELTCQSGRIVSFESMSAALDWVPLRAVTPAVRVRSLEPQDGGRCGVPIMMPRAGRMGTRADGRAKAVGMFVRVKWQHDLFVRFECTL